MFANAGFSMAAQIGHAVLSGSLPEPPLSMVYFSRAPFGWLVVTVVGVALAVIAVRLDRARGTSDKHAPAPFPELAEAACVAGMASTPGLAA